MTNTTDKTFMIKSYDPTHTCIKIIEHKSVTSKWIVEKFANQVKTNPDMNVKTMKEILGSTGIQVSYMKMYRTRNIAVEINQGASTQSYALLLEYVDLVLKNMLGFKKGCRPFISIDVCHLKGKYGGVLLSAISVDGNNALFSIAFGIVEVECKDSLRSFSLKGLSDAVGMIFPYAQQRCCSRHLYQNFRKSFLGLILKKHFWELNNEVYQWLIKNPLSMWARHVFDDRAKSDHATNNLSESFNQWIAELRHMPILILVDQLRVKMMERLYRLYEKGCGYDIYGVVTKNVKRKLDMMQQKTREYIVHPSSPHTFEVVKTYMDAYSGMIQPLPDLSELKPTDPTKLVQPPILKRRPGRPHTSRKKDGDEEYKGRSNSGEPVRYREGGEPQEIDDDDEDIKFMGSGPYSTGTSSAREGGGGDVLLAIRRMNLRMMEGFEEVKK
ncbi:uncharacterized protein LOC122652326 [Telopea speciosissima]|uniref:uncharacterized protein LOC122652326 n=1 Tax=Telopea speciosissima TaxID=54955 RepID=UPI001CC81ED9|nr:uncharacterized protein LOC122652326 [Telopea speciosissima]